jgi:hypothetical protein
MKTMATLLLAVLATGIPVQAQEINTEHSVLTTLLTTYVQKGRVDYAELKKNRQDLDNYLKDLSTVKEAPFRAWQKNERLAFLINLYNAETLQLIIDHYPVKSIKDIGGFIKGPWKQPVVALFGKTITLNTLEHKIIRKQFNEPRIHAALVCAAKGCPPLRSEAYVGAHLDEQLTDQMRAFLANASQNRVVRATGKVHLSKIFKWYGKDFTKNGKTLLRALAPYWPQHATTQLQSRKNWSITYTDYDWALNER